MLKIFWDSDNIGVICNHLNAIKHSHCVLQVFVSLGAPLKIIIDNARIETKCIITRKNVPHSIENDGSPKLSIFLEPSSAFSKELTKKLNGDFLICNSGIETIQQKAAMFIDTNDKQRYKEFIQDLADYLGIKRNSLILDERITEILEILQNCDCYDHTIEHLAKSICLSSSRLSHLFREQIGVPLKSYILFHQLEKAFTALLSGTNVTDAAMLAGFDSPSHFAATVKKWMGMPVSASIKDSEFLKVFI